MKKKHNLGNEAVYDARTLGCLLMACILSAAIGISLGERNAHNHHTER